MGKRREGGGLLGLGAAPSVKGCKVQKRVQTAVQHPGNSANMAK